MLDRAMTCYKGFYCPRRPQEQNHVTELLRSKIYDALSRLERDIEPFLKLLHLPFYIDFDIRVRSYNAEDPGNCQACSYFQDDKCLYVKLTKPEEGK